jgi:DNA polymerase-3 subunit alpha
LTNFVHLHLHSHYSILDGVGLPEEYVSAAKKNGQSAIAVTDHGNVSAHREWQIACKDQGIKPILGIEAYISSTDRFDKRDKAKRSDGTDVYNHIIILAKNEAGLKNLYKLSEIAWTEGYYYKPRIDLEVLEEYKEGLIVLSGCLNGLISKALAREDYIKAREYAKWFQKQFSDDFYIEVQAHNPFAINEGLLTIADELGIKAVATSDCHFPTKDLRDLEEVMLILNSHPKQSDVTYDESTKIKNVFNRLDALYPDRQMSFAKYNLYAQDYFEIKQDFIVAGFEREDIFANTVEIADKIGEYPFYQNVPLLPKPKKNAMITLTETCENKLVEMKLDTTQYRERLYEELEVIKNKDFASYFLVVGDMFDFARRSDILTGIGRGSAAGSLVCYLMGITGIDPIKYDLLFYRFINPERNDYPDIDSDIMDSRRGEVKEYIRKKFKHVASISTFTYFKDKGVIRDVARVFTVPLADVNKVLKQVETLEEFEESKDAEWFRDKYPEVLEYAVKLKGRIRSVGMHAAGLVVAKEPIANYVPIETRKDDSDEVSGRVPVIAYDMDAAADIGLIKIDVLGLKTLTVVDDTVKMIRDRHKKNLVLQDIPLDDPAIYSDLSKGYTLGVFQCEAKPYTRLLVKMGVDSFEDLAASNALVRPGAMNTVGASYIARKSGSEMTEYVHPIMQEFTARTYGVIIYQEQVMQACVHLAGMSWAEADKIRKIIGKKKDASEFDAYRDRFIQGATKNVSKEVAEHLWHDFEAHAGYSFNRSHAVAYSVLSYWTAWLKHYFPVEFMCAILKNEDDQKARTRYLLEAKRLGIKILIPHVNESDLDFSIQGNTIRFGLANVKYISDNIGKKIIANRPYDSFAHLKATAAKKGSGINSKAISVLNSVGSAAFKDNPIRGDESEFFYEYLSIPKFDTSRIPFQVKDQIVSLEDVEDGATCTILAMVSKIKKGKGWTRIELVDDSGSVDLFHDENTKVQEGNMYLFLIGGNRIVRYVTIDEVLKNDGDPYIRFLYAKELKIEDEEVVVLNFTPRRTKANKLMAQMIISNKNKELMNVVAFPKAYGLALGKMQAGKVAKPNLGTLDDGTVFLKEK